MTPAQIAEATLKAAQVQAAAAQSQTLAAWVGTIGGLLTLGANVLFAIRSGVRERDADEQARVREDRAEAAAQDRIRAEDEAARKREDDAVERADSRAAAKHRAEANALVARGLALADRTVVLMQQGEEDARQRASQGDQAFGPPSAILTAEFRRDIPTAMAILLADAEQHRALWTMLQNLQQQIRSDSDPFYFIAMQAAQAADTIQQKRLAILEARELVADLHQGDEG